MTRARPHPRRDLGRRYYVVTGMLLVAAALSLSFARSQERSYRVWLRA